MGSADDRPLLLGEWACLGILYPRPAHGFAVATRLAPSGDIGRVWSLSRPLTYRALEQLGARGYVHAVGEEPGIAGGNRTILSLTRTGRAELRRWLTRPVRHLRDLRSELLLKLVLADSCGIDLSAMLAEQRRMIAGLAGALQARVDSSPPPVDVVALWRSESARAALRFLDQIDCAGTPPPARDARQ